MFHVRKMFLIEAPCELRTIEQFAKDPELLTCQVLTNLTT